MTAVAALFGVAAIVILQVARHRQHRDLKAQYERAEARWQRSCEDWGFENWTSGPEWHGDDLSANAWRRR